MRLKALAALLLIVPAAALIRSEPAAAASCGVSDIHALGLRLDARRVPVLDGWLNEAAYRQEVRRVCASVPARWRWTEQSFDRATDVVDRVFPGAGTWADVCASSEGGHGAWVPNRSGSGAGGWLQFMSGTFYGIIGSALSTARSAGVHVPGFATSWYSPVGQAFAGAEMLRQGRRGEWTGSTC